jgi:hypothetical protein
VVDRSALGLFPPFAFTFDVPLEPFALADTLVSFFSALPAVLVAFLAPADFALLVCLVAMSGR